MSPIRFHHYLNQIHLYTFTPTDVSCNGGSDALINVASPTGGNGGTYEHRLDGGSYSTTFPYNYNSLSGNLYNYNKRWKWMYQRL